MQVRSPPTDSPCQQEPGQQNQRTANVKTPGGYPVSRCNELCPAVRWNRSGPGLPTVTLGHHRKAEACIFGFGYTRVLTQQRLKCRIQGVCNVLLSHG